LLRALETRQIRRIGEWRPRDIDGRIIAATNRRLEREITLGRFREDLYFRLAVVRVELPPLPERPQDLDLFIATFLEQLHASDRRLDFTGAIAQEMRAHLWPGNIRELRNFVERSIVFGHPAPAFRMRRSTPAPQHLSWDVEVPFKAAKDMVVRRFEE